jgi:hypothetical protein
MCIAAEDVFTLWSVKQFQNLFYVRALVFLLHKWLRFLFKSLENNYRCTLIVWDIFSVNCVYVIWCAAVQYLFAELWEEHQSVSNLRNVQLSNIKGNTLCLRCRANLLMLFGETVAVYYENHTKHTDTVCTSQETHYVSATEPNRLMLFRETVAVYCENHMEHTDTVRTSQETLYISTTEPKRLMLFGETVAVRTMWNT